MNGKKEFGDYQTPFDFAEKVVKYVCEVKGINPDLVVEPTCGIGNFVKASLVFSAKSIVGLEINKEYCTYCEENITDKRVKIINTDFFKVDLKHLIASYHNVLAIGNPPWVTNSALSTLNSVNLPSKINFKQKKGMEAITGGGNFDICEYMILKLIYSLSGSNATIVMLCKTSVARNIFAELKRNNIPFSECELLEFDSAKLFGISASACVLYLQLSNVSTCHDFCQIYDFESLSDRGRLETVDGTLLNRTELKVPDYNGKCEFEWRQGVKHDCSKIMELKKKEDTFVNGLEQEIDIEDTLVYPLVKSSAFKTPIISSFSKYVIVTQHYLKEKTDYLASTSPKTWQYLNRNHEYFEKRKSAIYCESPLFSMFGIGDYSFSRFKVGVSGFYKSPLFSVLFSADGKPVMTDDTSYFIAFDSYQDAYVAMLILNSDSVQLFIKSIAFLDAKRPYTKKILERISFSKLLHDLDINDLQKTEEKLGLLPYITMNMLENFLSLPVFLNKQLLLSI